MIIGYFLNWSSLFICVIINVAIIHYNQEYQCGYYYNISAWTYLILGFKFYWAISNCFKSKPNLPQPNSTSKS